MAKRVKILYITTVGEMMPFFTSLIHTLIERGYVVDIAANISNRDVPECYRDWNCKVYSLSCERSPLRYGNIKAVQEIHKIVLEGKYDIVHCHTPIASLCTRLACRSLRHSGLKVLYTAHGFHFYKGAPLKNWLIYYPIEWICGFWTDVLITINQEDYTLAQKHMHAKKVLYVPGVGIPVKKFREAKIDKNQVRREMGVPEDAFLLLSLGELNKNKNHQVVMEAIVELNDPSIHYAIAGKGELHDYLMDFAEKLGIKSQVHLLGYRNDVASLYKSADVNVFPSIREGLGLAALEGMAAGVPLICADNRGTRDYANKKNAIVCPAYDASAFARAISLLKNNPSLRKEMAKQGQFMAEHFSIESVNALIQNCYHNICVNGELLNDTI